MHKLESQESRKTGSASPAVPISAVESARAVALHTFRNQMPSRRSRDSSRKVSARFNISGLVVPCVSGRNVLIPPNRGHPLCLLTLTDCALRNPMMNNARRTRNAPSANGSGDVPTVQVLRTAQKTSPGEHKASRAALIARPVHDDVLFTSDVLLRLETQSSTTCRSEAFTPSLAAAPHISSARPLEVEPARDKCAIASPIEILPDLKLRPNASRRYLPVAPLCSEDCAGPDPDRFPTTVVVEPDPDEPPPADPRWAALSEITFNE